MRPSTHPGAILKDEIDAIDGLTVNSLALKLRVPASRLDRIVKQERSVTPDTAIRLATFFGGSPKFWLNLQQTYDLSIVENEKGDAIRREVQIDAA